MQRSDTAFRQALAAAWQSGAAEALPVHFRASVLLRYLEQPGTKILRTDTIGRLLRPGRAVLDFGLVEDDRVIHLRFSDLSLQIPEGEREHWLAHLLTPPLSSTLLRMQQHPGSCHDDGSIRAWQPEPD